MEAFREVLEDWHLSDLGFVGPKFTWSNNFTKERFDRAVANPRWCELFGEVDIFVLDPRSSDHCPLLVNYGEKVVEAEGISTDFKLEASWLVNDACYKVVKDAWEERECDGDPLDIFQSKLEKCKLQLII